VLVVLINVSESENVMVPRPRFGMPAFLAAPAQAGPSVSTRAFSARPSADLPSADLPSADLPCAAAMQQHAADARTGWAGLLPTGPATTYTTRILASEGASGPHPAREPEPV
jgi:hypothetical protein